MPNIGLHRYLYFKYTNSFILFSANIKQKEKKNSHGKERFFIEAYVKKKKGLFVALYDLGIKTFSLTVMSGDGVSQKERAKALAHLPVNSPPMQFQGQFWASAEF